tara:strand:+ start:7295 stop:7762 length:468 start_codon:yes stop_codon:yes gene_type:complete
MAGYRAATQEDLDELAPKVREADRIEIFCSHGMTPEEGLQYSWLTSKEVNAAYNDEEEVMAIFGWGLDEEGSCVPWLLASDELQNNTKVFVKGSRIWVRGLMEKFSHGYNYTHAANEQSLKWLKMCGIKDFEEVDGWGHIPSPFVKFSWTNKKEK